MSLFQYKMSLKPGSYFHREMRLNGGRSDSVMMRGLVIDREDARLHTLAQIKAFLDGTAEGAFRVPKEKKKRCRESYSISGGHQRGHIL